MGNKILLIDDDFDSVQSFKMVLEKEGFEVEIAENRDEGLERMKEKKFELILLDIMMPGMTIVDFLNRIKDNKELGNTKIAYLTVAVFSDEDKKNITKEKMIVDFIMKSVDLDEFVRRVRRALEVSVDGK